MSQVTLEIKNPEESDTISFAEKLATNLRPGDLVVLSGELGAGKTFLTRALAHSMGLEGDERVTSPTYTLVHELDTNPPIVHADLYRLTDPDEVYELGLEHKRDEGKLLIVEWGRPFVEELGGQAIFVDLRVDPRSICVSGECPRAQELVSELLARHQVKIA